MSYNTIDKWRSQFTEYNESFLQGVSKKAYKDLYKFHSLGPFLSVFSSGQEYYEVDLQQLIKFYYNSVNDTQDFHFTINIDGVKFYLADISTNHFVFKDGEDNAFIIRGEFEQNELIIVILVSNYSKFRVRTLWTLKEIHEQFNDSKMKRSSDGKF